MILGADVRHVLDARSSTTSRRRSWRSACRRSQGVGQVIVGGASSPAVRVEVDPTQLASYGLAMADVRAVLQRAELEPRARAASTTAPVRADILTQRPARARRGLPPLVIAVRNGARGAARRRRRRRRRASRTSAPPATLDGKPSVVLIIFRAARREHHRRPSTASAPRCRQLQASIPQAIDIDDRPGSHHDDPRVGRATSSSTLLHLGRAGRARRVRVPARRCARRSIPASRCRRR